MAHRVSVREIAQRVACPSASAGMRAAAHGRAALGHATRHGADLAGRRCQPGGGYVRGAPGPSGKSTVSQMATMAVQASQKAIE